MEGHTKEICTFYERNIIGTVDQHDHAFTPDFNFSGELPDLKNKNVKQYRLFRAYLNSQRINGHDTFASEEDLPPDARRDSNFSNHYNSDANMNNFTIQDSSDSGTTQEHGSNLSEVDQVFERHSKMIEDAGEEIEKKGPTPFTTMYYNDPQYAHRYSQELSVSDSNLSNQVNPRIGNNGLVANGIDQQAKDSLIQRVRSDPDGEEQMARPATKDDYVMHNVKASDTLDRISIQYDVNKDAIKMANGFMGEEVYMFKVLKIPFTYGEVYHVPPDKDEEEEKKQWAKEQMHQLIRDSNRNNQNYESEVRFYLELNNYDMDKAMREYEEDMKFEKKVISDNKVYNQKKRRQRYENMG